MGPTSYFLDYLRTLLALLMLGYGSYNDIKTREIHDKVWLIFGGSGLVLDLYELFIESLTLRQLVISVGFMGLLMLLFGYFRLFGGADLLAFVALSLIHPKPPGYLMANWGWVPPLFSFTLVSNTALVGILTPFIIFFRNLTSSLAGNNAFESYQNVPLWKKVLLFFTGMNLDSEDIRGVPFEYPLETLDGDLKLRANIWEDEEAENILRKLRAEKNRIWVSATLPYILIMGGGYLLSIVFGDVLLWFFILYFGV
jgi:preflagellin peptidase FlaK